MALAQVDMNDLMTWFLLIVAIILVTIILYLGTRLIAGKKDTETGYIIRLVLVAIAIVLLVAVVIGALIGALDEIDITNIFSGAATQLVPVLIYLAIVLLIKYIIIPEMGDVTKWNTSIVIGLITLFLIYILNIITTEVFKTPIIQGV